MAKCCAPNCSNNQRKDAVHSFHSFPEDPSLRAEWISQIGRQNWIPGRRSLLCSAHFEENYLNREGSIVVLHKGAVPTIFPIIKRPRSKGIPKAVRESESHQKCLAGANKIFVKTSPKSGCSGSPASRLLNEQKKKNLYCNPLHVKDSSVVNQNLICTIEDSVIESCNPVIFEEYETKPLSLINSGVENVIDDHACYEDAQHKKDEFSEMRTETIIDMRDVGMDFIVQNNELTEDIQLIPHNVCFDELVDSSILSRPSELTQIKMRSTQNSSFPEAKSKEPSISSNHIREVPNILDKNLTMGNLGTESLSEAPHVKKYPNTKWQSGTWMCRLCGLMSSITLDVFSEESRKLKLMERIASVIPIKICRNEDLPHSVCFTCITRLDVCSQLIVTSLNTHKKWATKFKKNSNQMFDVSILHGKSNKLDLNVKDTKQKILLMEIHHGGEKSVEECLALAAEDIDLRLRPKTSQRRDPVHKLALITLHKDPYACYEQQIKDAVEAFTREVKHPPTIKTPHSKRNMRPSASNFENSTSSFITTDDTVTTSKDNNFGISIVDPEHSGNLILEPKGSLTKAVVHKKKSNIQPKKIISEVTLDPFQTYTQPVADPVSLDEFKTSTVRCPKLAPMWKSRSKTFETLQAIFLWKFSLKDGVQLMCKLCQKVVDSSENHLKLHVDADCCVCFGLMESEPTCQQCHPEDTPKVPLKQLYGVTLWRSMRNRRYCPWYQCSFCSSKFKSKHSMTEHLPRHLKCHGCEFEATDLDEAHNHQQSCSILQSLMQGKQQEFLCDNCGKKFLGLTALRKHKRIHIPAALRLIHQCAYCPKRFEYVSKLKEHQQRHEEKIFMCPECGKLFGAKQTLRQHEFTHGEPLFSCSLCTRTFFRKSHLDKHMQVHDPKKGRGPRAKQCGSRDGLNRCKECKQVFPEIELLSHYKDAHPNTPLSNYVCDICKEETTSYGALWLHQRDVHRKNVKECPLCGKTLATSTLTLYHVMQHEGMFPYNCFQCNKGYSSSNVLQDHIRRKHTGEKPFKCKECSKGFPTNSALIQHLTVHKGPDQLIPCPVCNQGFKRKAHLDVHMRIHTGVKPYICPICMRPFRQRPDCLKHIRVIHGEDPSHHKILCNLENGSSQMVSVSVADIELVIDNDDILGELPHVSSCDL